MKSNLLLLLAPALVLTACGEDPKPVAPTAGSDDRKAGGDVRGGTISDAMLPLETVQSQSPSLAKESDGLSDGSASADADGSAEAPGVADGETAGDSSDSSADQASDASE